MIRSQKVLRSAKGQECAGRFPGICNHNPETVVWAHLNGAAFGKGMGIKAHDVLGMHLCSSCHAYLDTGHGTRPLISTDTLLECVLSAVCETYVRLITAGIVIVPLDAERLSADKPTPPRKPKADRKAILQRKTPIPAHVGGIPSRPFQKKAKA
jgi:hypothetical protein